MAKPPVIIYGYDSSPFSHKINHILLLKNIPHQRVDVNFVLPRPEITDLLGISYRRIPILAIGNDVYCDTALISMALERRFPPSEGYGTIFPPRKGSNKTDTGIIKAFATHYAESAVFPLAVGLLPWEKMPSYFIEDRAALQGAPVDPKIIVTQRPQNKAYLSSHLALLEEQFSDDREWLFDTEAPGLADVSVYFIYAWIQPNRNGKDLFDPNVYPKTLKWLSRMATFIEGKKAQDAAPSVKVSGEEAAKIIGTSAFEPYDAIGFDEREAARLGLTTSDWVAVSPNDAAKGQPTLGKLVGLSREEIILEVQGRHAVVRCHFPKLNFKIKKMSNVQQKL